ncbi:UBP1-associated protein 2C-like [Nicotiana tabacum]|uniref:UBP1-associated protein 2C-like n=4 Tax=Nicotiana tabacum TaxID=4097 RepID=A0AC58TK79_TOBAC|nr:UBP1-associated protein 2C-like [Nicotiana tomentosiformis]XP_009605427.1 UBP1-associated protein 2C-like [Nicotiana tomentosiformis]XP_009605428.1 UBP1-associated protein 2C-like [Nicotiana tomentosiformis]XP_009605429.1 UBP1-associated protein 2C-like [Nicotiana tomentosiformis]XP_018627562.1 UBP1-associated protein 2C-like [Nicotiana tomentosiformis]
MDLLKKRKLEDNGVITDVPVTSRLTIEDARKILESVTPEQMLEILQTAVVRHADVLDQVRVIADRDTTQRKLFIRGLGWETNTEKLKAIFGNYGELEEAVVITDKATGKSKGYGFVTFKHVDGALLALKEPSKKIDGRMAVTQLASAGIQGGPGGGSTNNPVDVSARKIYVANVPYDMQAERILQHFCMYGEIEEGPLGFDKATGKSKGYALFVYKTAEAAKASLVDPVKNIDGHQLNCKLAIDGKKGGKPGGGAQAQTDGHVDQVGPGQYGGPSGITGYGGFPGHSTFGGPGGHGLNSAYGSGNGIGVGGPGGGSSYGGSQPGGSVSGGGYGGPYGGGGGSHYGGPGSAGYGALASSATGGGGGYGGPGALGGGGYGGTGALGGGGLSGVGGALGGAGRGSSMYGLPPSSTGLASGDYPPQGPHYSQQNQVPGVSPAPRVAPGGMYQGMHSYY